MVSKSILFVSVSDKSPSTRYRALNYFSELRSAGWQPEHFSVGQNPFRRALLLRRAAQADVVVVLRKMFSGLYPKLLKSAAKSLTFDFDDAIFMRSSGESSQGRMKRFARALAVCDQVWAGNDYLAAFARRYNPDVTSLATSIDYKKYGSAASKPAETIDLVWIGSGSTKKYLMQLMPTLESLSSDLENLRLKIVADFTISSSKLKVVPVPWDAENEARELASAHIGIAPIPDDAWTRGKCGLKLLQYIAAGLPVVASPYGVQSDMVLDGVNGYSARSVDEWRTAVLSLAADSALRKKMGDAGKDRVVRRFSTAVTFIAMRSALDALTTPGRKRG